MRQALGLILIAGGLYVMWLVVAGLPFPWEGGADAAQAQAVAGASATNPATTAAPGETTAARTGSASGIPEAVPMTLLATGRGSMEADGYPWLEGGAWN